MGYTFRFFFFFNWVLVRVNGWLAGVFFRGECHKEAIKKYLNCQMAADGRRSGRAGGRMDGLEDKSWRPADRMLLGWLFGGRVAFQGCGLWVK